MTESGWVAVGRGSEPRPMGVAGSEGVDPALTVLRGTPAERRFWQSGGGYDRNITSPRTLLAAIDYIHLNPVRKGLVEQAADWQWSSARHYQGGISPAPIDPIPPAWRDVELE
jgi:hypothetical protein